MILVTDKIIRYSNVSEEHLFSPLFESPFVPRVDSPLILCYRLHWESCTGELFCLRAEDIRPRRRRKRHRPCGSLRWESIGGRLSGTVEIVHEGTLYRSSWLAGNMV